MPVWEFQPGCLKFTESNFQFQEKVFILKEILFVNRIFLLFLHSKKQGSKNAQLACKTRNAYATFRRWDYETSSGINGIHLNRQNQMVENKGLPVRHYSMWGKVAILKFGRFSHSLNAVFLVWWQLGN